jgi:23S rRNA pseudouridine1911/1915/1917 synthase
VEFNTGEQPSVTPQGVQGTTRITVGAAHAGLRADVFLALQHPLLSRTRIRQKIQTGESLLNGRRFASSARLREGDVITMAWRGSPEDSPAPPAAAPAPPLQASVLFEDEVLLAMDKPAGMTCHPTGPLQAGTLIQAARAAYRDRTAAGLARGDPSFYPSLVNRLDRFTSGIVLVAKDQDTLRVMHRMAAAGEIAKQYIAVVEGRLEKDEGTLDAPLGPDPAGRVGIKMAVVPDGRPSVTRFIVARRLPGHTILRAFPLTGRPHQIRVHLAWAGHPVWGDLLYRDEALFLRYWESGRVLGPDMPPRHLLHAARVSFRHPRTGETIMVVSPLPGDYTAILETLEGPSPGS